MRPLPSAGRRVLLALAAVPAGNPFAGRTIWALACATPSASTSTRATAGSGSPTNGPTCNDEAGEPLYFSDFSAIYELTLVG